MKAAGSHSSTATRRASKAMYPRSAPPRRRGLVGPGHVADDLVPGHDPEEARLPSAGWRRPSDPRGTPCPILAREEDHPRSVRLDQLERPRALADHRAAGAHDPGSIGGHDLGWFGIGGLLVRAAGRPRAASARSRGRRAAPASRRRGRGRRRARRARPARAGPASISRRSIGASVRTSKPSISRSPPGHRLGRADHGEVLDADAEGALAVVAGLDRQDHARQQRLEPAARQALRPLVHPEVGRRCRGRCRGRSPSPPARAPARATASMSRPASPSGQAAGTWRSAPSAPA